MELELLGKIVLETLALQGKINGITRTMDSLKTAIANDNHELSKLASIKSSMEEKQAKLEKLIVQLGELNDELADKTDVLNSEGVALPVGDKVSNKQVRL